jgi:hypothetical protein
MLSSVRISRLALGAIAVAAALPAAGCVRGARVARETAPVVASLGPVARPGGSGFASFGSRLSLRTDTPSLTDVEIARAAALAALREREESRGEAYAESYGPVGACGPLGAYGSTDVYAPVVATGPYLAPGGAYGYPREPHDAPHRPVADVECHRPGLSVGSGVFARECAPHEEAHSSSHSHSHR